MRTAGQNESQDTEAVDFNDEEFQRLWKDVEAFSAVRVEKWVLWVFYGIAGILPALSTISSYNVVSRLRKEVSIPGRVMDMTEVQECSSDRDRVIEEYNYPVVEFTSETGEQFEVQLSEGSSPPSHSVGDEVTVMFDPAHPLHARINPLGSALLMWVTPVLTGVLGLAFLIGVMVVWPLLLE